MVCRHIDDHLKQVAQVSEPVLLLKRFRHFPNYREDRPFDGTHYPAIGCDRTISKSMDQLSRIHQVLAGQAMGDAPEYLRQDDTRVPPGPHECSVSCRLHDGGRACRLHCIDLSESRSHREEHVRARISIRDRKDVESVHRLVMLLQPGAPGHKQHPEIIAVQTEHGGPQRVPVKQLPLTARIHPRRVSRFCHDSNPSLGDLLCPRHGSRCTTAQVQADAAQLVADAQALHVHADLSHGCTQCRLQPVSDTVHDALSHF